MAVSIHPDPHLLNRICGEYREMPALRLTLDQAARLWAIDPALCAAALAALVRARCLWRTPDGVYTRRGVGEEVCEWRRARPVPAAANTN